MMRIFRIMALVLVLTLAHTSPAQGDELPGSAYVSGVNGHAQGYSLSCESRSAADWAAYWGVSVSETEFLEALPRSDNPDVGFVGFPGEAWGSTPPYGYGVHAEPVADTLREYGVEAQSARGLSWDDLRAEISAGRPVIVWVIGQMWDGTPLEYEATDGSTVNVAAYEHTMILTGYSEEAVEVVDAYSGQYQSYWLENFLKSWAVLGNMAVLGSSEVPSDAPEVQSMAGTYTVQPGDYLVELAQRFGTTWQELAEENSVPYPYTIFTGQVLQVPSIMETAETEPEETTAKSEPGVPATNLDFQYQAILPMVQRNFSDPNPFTPPVQVSSETVTVRVSDTLINFGHNVGVDWRSLAELNHLTPPYNVYPGQVLTLR